MTTGQSALLEPLLLESPVIAALGERVTRWQELNGYRVAAVLEGARGDAALTLRDLTHLPRTGFKGRGTAAWLAAAGWPVPPAPNRCLVRDDGARIARLGAEDFLLVDALDGSTAHARALEAHWLAAVPPGGLLRPTPKQHSHALLALSGGGAVDVMARLCAVDLRPDSFGSESVAQTFAAGVVVTVLPLPDGYLLLFDSAVAAYAWHCLVDALAGFDAAAVGCAQHEA